MVKVSVIIPCKEINGYTLRCINYLQAIPEKDEIEIFVVTDAVCPGLPSAKRNWAMERAHGEIFAFIDSDAYPSKYWLRNALFWLQFYDAVCGPGVLPDDAPYEEFVSDQVHQWIFCPYRVIPKTPQMVKWFPTFNLIVKKKAATQFELFLTGEDDKFGLKIKEGIFYHPDILVYHNRRGAFKPLWRQFGQWGKTKGHFFRLAVIAYITTLWTYFINFIHGFFKRKLS